MSSKAAISKLKNVWGKVGLDDIPGPEETRDNLKHAEDAPTRKKSERTAQLNLRIKPDEKQRIELIAVRERVPINEVFSRMLMLYEREHGKGDVAESRQAAKK